MNRFLSRVGISLAWVDVASSGGGSGSSGVETMLGGGGRVIDSKEGNGCTVLQVEIAPEWECSDEQIAETKRGYPSSGSTTPETTVAPGAATADDVALRPMDCEGLADLRRPALKDAQRLTLA